MASLMLIRHGESEWNEKNLLTGSADVSLTEKGREQARQSAKQLHGTHVDRIYTSPLRRTQQTLDELTKSLGWRNITSITSHELIERDYGNYTGREKQELIDEIGLAQYDRTKNDWQYTPPNGESLEMLNKRVLPFFIETIMPDLLSGKNVLLVSHHNVLRVILRHLDGISEDRIGEIEKISNSEILAYVLIPSGKLIRQNP